MKYIKIPNLPEKKVKVAFCDCRISPNIEKFLYKMDIETVKLKPFELFAEPVSAHPDMLCRHVGGADWIFYKTVYTQNKKAIDSLKLNVILINDPQSGKYPDNIKLNTAVLDNYLLCNKKYAEFSMLESKKAIININQGYAKCSVCVVDSNSIISADVGIIKSARECGIDTLQIKFGGIALDGYEYGFIGGCCGKIAPGLLFFTGNIYEHSNFDIILRFCRERDIEVIGIEGAKLYDYGGILPVLEE